MRGGMDWRVLWVGLPRRECKGRFESMLRNVMSVVMTLSRRAVQVKPSSAWRGMFGQGRIDIGWGRLNKYDKEGNPGGPTVNLIQ